MSDAGGPVDARVPQAAARIAAAGRAAYPAIALGDDVVALRLANRLRDDPDAQLDDLHDADVFLATALGCGDTAALQVFEDVLVPQIELALRRLRLPRGTDDEVKQALRVELLVEGGKIADYAGIGELAAWLRVSATRKALKLVRRAGREQTLDDVLLEHWPAPTPGPERSHMRERYTTELKRAIQDAFAELAVRQRNLLRQHILDELTIDDLARVYRVHRATCARWLADARTELGRGTRKKLVVALGLPRDELDSLLRFLDSDIELSMSRVLATR
jgi:RNA polymerase sigma-70 factor, ECF subfamily